MPCSLEDVGDRPARELVAHVSERTLNPRVAPCRILSGHANDEVGGLRFPSRPAGLSPFRVVPLTSNELAVPGENRVGRDDSGDLLEDLSTEGLALYREPTAFIIGQPKSSATKLSLEDSVLLEQIVDDVLLVTVDPAGEGDQQELPWVERAHGGRC